MIHPYASVLALLVACTPRDKSAPDAPGTTLTVPADTTAPTTTSPVDTPATGCDAGAALLDSQPRPTLRDALDEASPGAVVEVCPGTHFGSLSSAVPIVLIGGEGVVLDGDGLGTTLTVPAGSEIRALTLTGGRARLGGGLSLVGEGDVIVADCTIEGNEASEGGGGLALGPGITADLTGTVVRDNRAGDYGGGAWLDGAVLVGGEIADNVAEHASQSYRPAYGGGGVCATGPSELRGTDVHDNRAVYGGGVSVVDGELLLTDAVVHGNRAVSTGWIDGAGGGANVARGALTLAGSAEIAENTAYGCGGILALRGTVRQGVVRDNTSDSYGGGVCAFDEATLEAVAIRDNAASSPYDGTGGGVYVVGEAVLADLVVSGNDALMGGGILIETESIAAIAGGEISGNTGRSGVGVYAFDDSVVDIEGTAIVDNVATELGGAMWAAGTVRLTDAAVLRNQGYEAGGIFIERDMVLLECTDVDFGEDADDNLPWDLTLFDWGTGAYVPFRYGDAATFACTPDGCI